MRLGHLCGESGHFCRKKILFSGYPSRRRIAKRSSDAECFCLSQLLFFGSLPVLQGFILVSCILAVLCNLSQYMCIGRFSATAFQVMGNTKTVLVIICGVLFFDTVLTVESGIGVVATLAGMVLYSLSSSPAAKAKKTE